MSVEIFGVCARGIFGFFVAQGRGVVVQGGFRSEGVAVGGCPRVSRLFCSFSRRRSGFGDMRSGGILRRRRE